MSRPSRLPSETHRRVLPPLDDAHAAWIVSGRRSFFDYSVGSLVPVAFEAYARVLHPAWTADRPVRWDAVAAWSIRTIHALAQWELLARPVTEARSSPPFDRPPDTGGLPPTQLATLSQILATQTSTPNHCFIGIWDGYGWLDLAEPGPAALLELDQRAFWVHEGPLSSAARVGWRHADGTFVQETPSLIWPADRSWFVAGDTDLDSTYIGGSDRMISALLDRSDLEAWAVEPTDRVAFDSDSINGPG